MRSSSEVYSLMSMKSLTRLGTAVSPASELEREDSRAPPRSGLKCAPDEGNVLCGEFFRVERRGAPLHRSGMADWCARRRRLHGSSRRGAIAAHAGGHLRRLASSLRHNLGAPGAG